MQIIKGINRRPRKVLLYGTHGIGKTTWAAGAGKVIVLATEDGQGDVGCDRTPLLKSLASLNASLSDLTTQPHDYTWLAIDTLDWLEKLIFAQVCIEKGKRSIEEIGYAKGYKFAAPHWAYILDTLDNLVAARRMGILLLAHSRIVKIEEPELDSYNKYEPDLHKESCGMLQEWCDEVFFARYRVNTLKTDEGFNRTRTRVVGDNAGDRVVYTTEGPGFFAKRRIPMPDQIPLDFAHYLAYIKQAYGAAAPNEPPKPDPTPINPTTPQAENSPSATTASAGGIHNGASDWEKGITHGNIAGMINDGSSKPPIAQSMPEWGNEF